MGMQKVGIIVEAKKQLQAVLAGAKDIDVLDEAARRVIQDFVELSAGSKAIDDLQKEYMELARSIDVARKSSKDHSSAQINELKSQREELKRVVAAAKELEGAQVAGRKPEQVKALEKLKKEGVVGVETGADAVKEYGDKLAEVEKQIKSLQESGGKLTKEQVEGFKKQEVAIAATQKALRDLLRGGVDPWSRRVEGVLKRSTKLIKDKQTEIETLQKRTEDVNEKELIGIDKKIKAAEAYIDVLQDAHRESAKLPDIERAKLGLVGTAGRGAVKVGIAGAAGEVGDIEKVREQGSAAMARLKGLGKMALGGGIIAFLLSSVRTWAQIDTELLKVQRRFGDIEGSVWSLSNRLGFTKREMMELAREYGKISNVFEREGMGATIGYARTMGVPAAAAIRLREVGRWAEKPVDMKRYLSALERQGKELGLDRGRQEEMFNILITHQQKMSQQVFGGYGSEGVPMGVMQGMDYLWGGTERGRGVRGLDYTTRVDESMKDVQSDAIRSFLYRAYGFGQFRTDPETGEQKRITITDVMKRIEAGVYGFGPGGESNLEAVLERLKREYGAGALGEEQSKLIYAAMFKHLKMFEVEPLHGLPTAGMFSSQARDTLTRYGKAQGKTGPELETWIEETQKELMGKTEAEQAKILEGRLRPGAKGVLLEATKIDKANQELLSKIEQLEKSGTAKPGEIKVLKEDYQKGLRARTDIDTNVSGLAKDIAEAGFVEEKEFYARLREGPEELIKSFSKAGKDFEDLGGKFVSIGEEFKVGLELLQRESVETIGHVLSAFKELAGEGGLKGFMAELGKAGESLGGFATLLKERGLVSTTAAVPTVSTIGELTKAGDLTGDEAAMLIATLSKTKQRLKEAGADSLIKQEGSAPPQNLGQLLSWGIEAGRFGREIEDSEKFIKQMSEPGAMGTPELRTMFRLATEKDEFQVYRHNEIMLKFQKPLVLKMEGVELTPGEAVYQQEQLMNLLGPQLRTLIYEAIQDSTAIQGLETVMDVHD